MFFECKIHCHYWYHFSIIDQALAFGIKHINPINTSIGYWRIGRIDQIYGRFGRGFNYTNGKNTAFALSWIRIYGMDYH